MRIRLQKKVWNAMFVLPNIVSLFCFSQPANKDYILSTAAHYGFVIAHHGSMQYLVDGHTPGFEFNFIKPMHGQQPWQRVYHYPEIGLSFYYIYLSNPDQLGNGFSLHPFINLNLTHGSRFRLKLKMATSLGYLTRKFDRLGNHKNNAVGTHVNAYANLRLNADLRLSENLRLEMGLGLSHFSNGAFTLPNLGINIPTLDLGLGYHFNNRNITQVKDTFTIPPGRNRFVFYAAAGLTEVDPPGQHKKYGAYSFSANFERQRGNKNRWNGGVEMAYNSSYLVEYRGDTTIHLNSDLENLQVGLRAGYALVIGRLAFPYEMGVYLYSKQASNGPFFHRIGFRYQLNDHWIVNLTLRTHWAKADFFEWGVGYSIGMRK